jgi:hypothetical protein
MARPTDLTPELADRVAQLIRAGNVPETAAIAAGVSGRTFYRWMARGEQAEDALQRGRRLKRSEEPFWLFWQQVKRAERENEAILVGYVMKSAPTTPTAAIALLERRFRDRWSRTERRELTGDGGRPIHVESATPIESPAERIMRDGERVQRRLLGVPDGWTAEQVDAIQAEALAFARQQVVDRLGPVRAE